MGLYRAVVIPLLLLFAGCGPIIGASMVAGGGAKDFTLVSGQLKSLKPGSRVLVVAPFAKTDEAFYICRGEEAANFTSTFNDTGLFQADFHLSDRFAKDSNLVDQLKQKSPALIQSELGLAEAPDLLMSGVILNRSMVAAPAQGIMMDVGYRLEFYDLRSQKTTSVEIQVKDLFQECIGDAVNELMSQISSH
jgi:hypothetical protein